MFAFVPLSARVFVDVHLRDRIAARDDERGASLVEYALLLVLIVLVCIAAVTALGGTTSGSVSEAVSKLG